MAGIWLGDLREDLLRYFRMNKMGSLEILADGRESAKGLSKLDEFFGFGNGDKGMKISAFRTSTWEDLGAQACPLVQVPGSGVESMLCLIRGKSYGYRN